MLREKKVMTLMYQCGRCGLIAKKSFTTDPDGTLSIPYVQCGTCCGKGRSANLSVTVVDVRKVDDVTSESIARTAKTDNASVQDVPTSGKEKNKTGKE